MNLFLPIVCLLLFLPSFVEAAELRLETGMISPRAGDTFIVDLFLDTQSEVVNALEGALIFPSNLVLRDIRLSGSFVPLWVSSPYEKETGVIEFAGILPGGYQEQNSARPRGNVFTLVFQAQRAGVATITFTSQTAVYLNDGKGTRAGLTVAPLSLSIRPSSGSPQEAVLENDTLPPEAFTPLIVSGEPFGYAGPVLIFSTQDKDSGILRYDVARSYNRYAREKNLPWQETESPYVLTAEDADTYVFVRAVDQVGNTYRAFVPPQKPSIMTLLYTWWFVGLVLFVGVILLGSFFLGRRYR